jgi:hypothetical protein
MGGLSRQLRRAAERAALKVAAKEPPSKHQMSERVRQGMRALLGAGASALVIALVVESMGQAGILNMANARAMLAGAWIIGTAAFCVSEWIWQFRAKHRIAVAVAVSLILGVVLGALGKYESKANYELTHLVADNRPTPKNSCGDIGATDLLVFLGDGSAVVRPSKFPFTIIEMGRDRKGEPLPLLVIDKTDRGISIKTLRIFNADGKLGTKIDSDAWIDNSNFHSTKINAHQLKARDDQDQVVLDLDYINKHAVRITGVFRHPRMYPLEITPKEFLYGGGNYSIGCVIAPKARAAYFIDGPRL